MAGQAFALAVPQALADVPDTFGHNVFVVQPSTGSFTGCQYNFGILVNANTTCTVDVNIPTSYNSVSRPLYAYLMIQQETTWQYQASVELDILEQPGSLIGVQRDGTAIQFPGDTPVLSPVETVWHSVTAAAVVTGTLSGIDDWRFRFTNAGAMQVSYNMQILLVEGHDFNYQQLDYISGLLATWVPQMGDNLENIEALANALVNSSEDILDAINDQAAGDELTRIILSSIRDKLGDTTINIDEVLNDLKDIRQEEYNFLSSTVINETNFYVPDFEVPDFGGVGFILNSFGDIFADLFQFDGVCSPIPLANLPHTDVPFVIPCPNNTYMEPIRIVGDVVILGAVFFLLYRIVTACLKGEPSKAIDLAQAPLRGAVKGVLGG